MKKLHILREILHRTKADKILMTYIIFVFIIALIILMVEPGIDDYGDALWYCYAVLSTAGFGDVLVKTFIAKVCSVILTAYSLLVFAIITGVVVNFYTQIIQLKQKDTLTHLMDKLEHLPDMTKEELAELSEKVNHFRNT